MTITKKPVMPLHTLLLSKRTFGFTTASNISTHYRKKITLTQVGGPRKCVASVLRSNAGRAMARHFSAQGRTLIWYNAAQKGGRWDTSLVRAGSLALGQEAGRSHGPDLILQYF